MIHRRHQALNVWPALADLMTVLAVPALSTALGRVNGTQVARAEPAGELSSTRESLLKLVAQSPELFETQPGLALRVKQADPVRFERASSALAPGSDLEQAMSALCQRLCPRLSGGADGNLGFRVEIEGRYAADEPHTQLGQIADARARKVAAQVKSVEACRDCRWSHRACENRGETAEQSRGRPPVELFVVPDWRQIPSAASPP